MTQALALGINRRTLYHLRDEGQIERELQQKTVRAAAVHPHLVGWRITRTRMRCPW
jgi:hypothetical protein